MKQHCWMGVNREAVSIFVSGNKSLLEKLAKQLIPYFNVTFESPPVRGCWKISLDEEGFLQLQNTKEVFEKKLYEPDCRYLINPGEKFIQIVEPKEVTWRLLVANRLIRDMSRNLLADRMIYFHSAMLNISGKGICIMGNKRAGKTSTLLLLLIGRYPAAYISNDDLSIQFQNDQFIGYGWPRSISIRNDTFPAVGLDSEIRNFRLTHPSNFTTKLNSTFLYSSELVALVKRQICVSHQVDVVIFPQYVDSTKSELQPLDYESTYELLINNLEPDINKYFKNFASYFDTPKPTIHQTVEMMARKVAGYRLYQNFSNLNSTLDIFEKVFG